MSRPDNTAMRLLPLAGGFVLLALLVVLNTRGIAGDGGTAALFAGARAQSAAALEYWYAFLPRLSVALMAGAGLGLAGAVFQHVLQNPLASPATLAVTSGAQLALVTAVLLAPELRAEHPFLIALAGSFAAWALVAALAGRRMNDPITLVLTGMIVSFTLGAISICFFILKEQYLTSLFLWGAGDLAQYDWSGAVFLLPRLGLGALCLLALARPLALIGLGRETARSAGLATGPFSVLALGIAIFLSATVTAAVGLIAFVGLASPHLASLMGARRVVPRLFLAALIGALLVGLVDQAIQYGLSGLASFLPAGALTGLLGAPLLFYLLRKMPTAGPMAGETLPVARGVTSLSAPALLAALAAVFAVCLALAFLVPIAAPDIAWQWRAPRVLAAALSGGALGLAGCLIQRLLSNPMASPEIIGVSTGSVVGLIAVMLLAPVGAANAQIGGAVLGAFVVLLLILAYGRRHDLDPRKLILIGIAITAFSDALVLMFLAIGDPRSSQVLAYVAGSTYRVGFSDLAVPALIAGIGVACLPATLRWLDILPLGAATSRALGVPLGLARFAVVASAALLSAAACLFVGPISFVGLMAPHIARLLGLRRVREQLAGALLAGASLVVLADWIGRRLFRPYELPAGLMAILVGAAVVLALMMAERLRARQNSRDAVETAGVTLYP